MRNNIKHNIKKWIISLSRITNDFVPVSMIRNIDIEPIARCNLHCDFCQVPGWERAKETKPMAPKFFNHIISQLPGLHHIKIQGMGEPLLNPHIIDLVTCARNRNIKTTVITNGTVLTEKLSQQLLNARLSNFIFSFDGAMKKTYENRRKNANFETVVHNIRTVCALKRSMHAKTDIILTCLVSSQAVLHELPELIDLAHRMGVDHVYLKERLKEWHYHDSSSKYTFTSKKTDSLRDYTTIIEKTKKRAHEVKIGISIGDNTIFSKTKPCFWPWNALYISTEGKVIPCCALGIPETWTMGDLTQESIKTIWNNSAYRNLRRHIRTHRIPELCKGCYS